MAWGTLRARPIHRTQAQPRRLEASMSEETPPSEATTLPTPPTAEGGGRVPASGLFTTRAGGRNLRPRPAILAGPTRLRALIRPAQIRPARTHRALTPLVGADT